LSSSERPAAYHFVGVGGSGMSALAFYHAALGGRVSGSDRAFDRGGNAGLRAALAAAGIAIAPQDGSGVVSGCDAVVISTAVEDDNADVRAARGRGVPLLHRSELLARFVRERRTIAVTGTSGKSTVVAMTFAALRGAGLRPSVITGGALIELEERGVSGNAWADPAGELLVVEADESDGSLVRYEPWCGVVLNLQRDHKETAEVAAMFRTFRDRVAGPLICGEDANLDELRPDVRFGFGPRADVRAEAVELRPDGSRFRVGGTEFALPTPGRHDVLNALAATAVAAACGAALPEVAAALRDFRGVARRFRVVGAARGVTVVDDFAHNPDKLRAALAAGRLRAGRILAVFQPHGFGPTRFLRDDLVAAFAGALTPGDVLWLPEIFFAGGTVTRDISSQDIAREVRAAGRDARFAADRADLPRLIAAEARAGDLVLVMGARDPSLTDLARDVLAAVAAQADGAAK
jgi:UDP-N-acetylmuramate--L-alanine ligase